MLSLYDDKSRTSADVKAIALGHLNRINGKIGELQSLRNALSALINARHGDRRQDCPILNTLAGDNNSDLD
jgi:hypothetical protein